jgi:HAD superfamily hydrolase (TIGR01484 family)
MRYLLLATDYDGTLAHDGQVDDATWEAVGQLRQSGRKVLLVTGRELNDLLGVCPHVDRLDGVVAENGALLYWPQEKEVRQLAERPPDSFVEALARKGVKPVSVGHVIVATWRPHEKAVLEAIRDAGLELQVIFNKDAVMVLPTGVNKATGLEAALKHLGLSRHNTVGIGDAENDHAFLSTCECAVAVANAVPALAERADWVTQGPRGAGVVELVRRLLQDDLASLEPKLARHRIPLGTGPDGAEQTVSPYGCNVLVAGTSGSGKSTFTTAFLEALDKAQYQFVVIDPEGDYATLEETVVLGLPERAPLLDEVLDVLRTSRHSAVVNLLGVPLEARPAFFARLWPRLSDLRGATGRPHWVAIDETHHLMPKEWLPSAEQLPRRPQGLFLVTVHPGSVAPPVLQAVDVVLALGEAPEKTLAEFARARGAAAPAAKPVKLEIGQALMWRVGAKEPPFVLRGRPPETRRRRHLRKYAAGKMPEEDSFVFRGPQDKLNLRARNLVTFLELGAGVDDDTWLHHLRRHDYSRWFRDAVNDRDLAEEVERIEANNGADAAASRAAVRRAVESRYTLPAEPG